MDDVGRNNNSALYAGSIVCFGTSNTYGYAPDRYPDFQYPEGCAWPEIIGAETDWLVLNYGVCGRQIPFTERQIQRIRGFVHSWVEEYPAPILLWIELGTNDLLRHDYFRAEDAAARMEWFLRGLLEESCVRGSVKDVRELTERRDILPEVSYMQRPAQGSNQPVEHDGLYRSYRPGDYMPELSRERHAPGDDPDASARTVQSSGGSGKNRPGQGRGAGVVYLRLISPPCPRTGEWIPDPVRAAEFGRLGIVYRDLARKLGVDYTDTTTWKLPLAYDGVHLTEEGHRIFAKRAIADILNRDFGSV